MESPLGSKAALLITLLSGPGYGLDLIERVATGIGSRPRQGSVYPALRAIERKGLVRGWDVRASPSGGRPRRYYELTPKGIAVAKAQRAAIAAFARIDPPPAASPRDLVRMRDHLQDCASLSAFALTLRDHVTAARRP